METSCGTGRHVIQGGFFLLLLLVVSSSAFAAGGALGIGISLRNATIQQGSIAMFNLTAANTGNVSLLNVSIVDSFGTALSLISANQTINASNATQVMFVVNAISPGSVMQIEINFTSLTNGSSVKTVNVSGVDENGTAVVAGATLNFTVQGDSFEQDNSPAQARNVSKDGTPAVRNFGIASDQDWFRFEAKQGSIYRIETKNITPFFSKNSTDTVIVLYDDTVNVTTFSDDILAAVDFNSRIIHTAIKSGTMFVRVTEAAGTAGGVYSLSIKELGRLSAPAFNVQSMQVAKGFLTTMNATVRCAGGECPAVVVTLDPEPASKEDHYLQRMADGEMVPVIVKLRDARVSKQSKGKDVETIREFNVNTQRELAHSTKGFSVREHFDAINAMSGRVSQDGYEALLRSPDVLAIYPDTQVRAFLNESVTIINASRVHNLTLNSSITGNGASVCVIDTGISYTHSDFGSCSITNVRNGACAAVTQGFDFVNNDDDPLDDEGHGSHIAGIIASRDPAFRGVAPAARITPIKALDATGSGSASNVIAGINWCIANATRLNITAISMSLGDVTSSQGHCDDNNVFANPISQAVQAGLLVVVASGNDGFGGSSNAGISSPACVSNATAVGSTTKQDTVSSFTNRAPSLDVLAPGSGITSTLFNTGSGHTILSGTSMATPHVAGVAALLSQFVREGLGRSLTPAQTRHAMLASGKPITDNITSSATNLSFKRIDAFGVVSQKGDVPTTAGAQPFWSLSANPQSCGTMNENATCTISWTVNASGNASTYEFFVIAEHEFDINLSARVNVSIINPTGNFTVRKSGATAINMSDRAVFTINVTNTGLVTLQNVTISDTFNTSDLIFVGGQISAVANGSGFANFTNASLPANQSFVFNVTFLALNRSASVNSSNNLSVRAFDGNLTLAAGAGAALEIRFVNFLPTINSTPTLNATSNANYTYDVDASDANGDNLTFSLSIAPSGMVMNISTGRIDWVPTNNQVGLNNVTVSVTDGRGANVTQNFTVNVTRSNTAPVINTSPIFNATEDALYVYDINATDSDNDNLTFNLTSFPQGMLINSSSGVISWTPNNAQVGANNVTVIVFDGLGANATQSYVVNVSNLAPVFVSTAPTQANESFTLSYDPNTTDEGQGNASYVLIFAPAGMMLLNATTGFINWTPNTSQMGQQNVSLKFNDGNNGTADQNFTIFVSEVSNATVRVMANINPVNMSSIVSYGINVTNTGKKNLTNAVVQVDVNGSDLVFLNASGVIVNQSTAFVRINLTVLLAQNQSANVTAVFFALNRTANVSSILMTTFNASDVAFVLSKTNTTTSRIATVNFPPVINSTPVLAAQSGSQYTYNVSATDVNNDTLSFTLSIAPFNMGINSTTGRITWNPLFNQSGLQNVTVIVFDGKGLNVSQSFTINVSRNNSAPNVTTQAITNATEDAFYVYDVNASDLENDTFIFSLVVSPAGMQISNSTGIVNFTPNNSQVGLINVTVTVADALNASTNHSFVLNVSNVVPNFTTVALLAANESRLYSYDANTTDESQGAGALYSLAQAPGGMVINTSSGLLTWIPNTSQIGQNNVSIAFADGNGALITQNFTVTVLRISNVSLTAFASPSSLNMSQRFNVVLNFTNIGAKNLTNPILIVDFNASDVQFILANVNASSANATSLRWENVSNLTQNTSILINATFLTLNRSNNQSSNFSIIASAQDGVIGLQANATIQISIFFVNFAPIINSSPITTAQSGTQYNYTIVAIDGNNDNLTFNLTRAPFNMAINVSSGRILWFPLFNQSGLENVTVVVFDGRGANATQFFVINVSRNNSPPSFTTTAITPATEDANYTYDVNASDLENDSISFVLTIFPSGMSLNASTGLIQWVPKNSQVGQNNVTVNATDALGNSSAQVFVITVANNPPNITTIPALNATEGVNYRYDVNATDEGDGNATYTLNISPGGMIMNAASGLINWTPNTSQTGQNNVSVVFNDGNGGVVAQAFTITVLDITKPSINITFPPNGAKFNESNVSIAFIAVDNAQVATCSRLLSGVNITDNATFFSSGTSKNVSIVTSVNGSEGLNEVMVSCADATGNINTINVSFIVDTFGPSVIIISPLNGFNTSGNIQVSFSIIEANLLNATLVFGAQTIILNQTGSFVLIVPESLNQTFTIRAFDQLNRSNASTVFFNVDRTPPRVVVAPNATVALFDGRGALVFFNASNATDALGIVSTTWDFDARDGIQVDAAGREVSRNFTVAATFNVTVAVTDPAGNQNISKIAVFVLRDSDGDGITDFHINGSVNDNCPLVVEFTNNASACQNDKDADGVNDTIDFIVGTVNNTITAAPGLMLVLNNGTANITDPVNFNGSAQVSFVSQGTTLVAFPFTFNVSSILDLSQITIAIEQGGILVKGIALPSPITKTLTLSKGNSSHNAVCVVDAQVDTLSIVSSNCRSAGEVEVNCTSSAQGFSCVDQGSTFAVSGLRNSAIRSFVVTPVSPPSAPASGGGGGGGSRFFDDGGRSGGGVSFESSPPLFTPRSSGSSKSFDDAQVIVKPSTQQQLGVTLTARSPSQSTPKVQSTKSMTELVSAGDDNSIGVLIVAILIVLVGIAAIVYVWKM
ncbi:S8 family serine peptidase [Candidatus Woesearchaeota archaeon]|nr:S8 family serine peptidase [Candidatus Woesearchaeota archaeon]